MSWVKSGLNALVFPSLSWSHHLISLNILSGQGMCHDVLCLHLRLPLLHTPTTLHDLRILFVQDGPEYVNPVLWLTTVRQNIL